MGIYGEKLYFFFSCGILCLIMCIVHLYCIHNVFNMYELSWAFMVDFMWDIVLNRFEILN